jgi:DNA polymerase-3 subunit delta'
MNRAASNSLLKTLEEPPKETLLILLTENAQLILPTIRSRCQEISFAIPAREKSLAWLEQQAPSAENKAWLALEEEVPLNVLRWHNNTTLINAYAEFSRAILEFQQLFFSTTCAEKLATMASQISVNLVLQWLRQFYQDCVRLKQLPGIDNVAHSGLIIQLNDVIVEYPAANWYKMEQAILSMQKLIRQQANINLQLALEDLLITIKQLYGRKHQQTAH